MAKSAKRTDPELWEQVKAEVTAGDKGGNPGEWSARKAQMAVQGYKRRGGGYEGKRRKDNSLKRWTEEEWGTKSGKDSRVTGERYLPKAAREALTDKEYRRTSQKKRRDTAKGRQFSSQPEDVAAKTGQARRASHLEDKTKAELMEEARDRDLAGRSKMNKDELIHALSA